MEFPFHFLRTNSVVTSRFDQLAKVLKGADVDALRRLPDPEMEAFARDLSRGLRQEFAPTRLITASVNGLDAHSLNFLFVVCLKHRVSAFIGESDLYIDATGVDGATAEFSAVTNSIATVWCQVSERTLDRAFEDALRAPSDMDTWVQVHYFGDSTAEFGVRMRMHLLDDGRFTIVWTVREDDSDLRTLTVATYEEPAPSCSRLRIIVRPSVSTSGPTSTSSRVSLPATSCNAPSTGCAGSGRSATCRRASWCACTTGSISLWNLGGTTTGSGARRCATP